MESQLNDLIEVLTEQLQLYADILALIEEEREALASARPDRVLEVVRRKENVLLKIQTLDESRRLICVRLAKAWGLKANDLHLGEIAERAGGREGLELKQLRLQMRDCVSKLCSANERNAAVCRGGIEVVQRAVEHIRRTAGQGEGAYGPNGSAGGGNGTNGYSMYRGRG